MVTPSILASETLLVHFVKIAWVPSQTPAAGSRFQRIIIGAPIFNFKLERGKPDPLTLFKYSTGYWKFPLSLSSNTAVSALWKLWTSPLRTFKHIRFRLSTASFLQHKNVQIENHWSLFTFGLIIFRLGSKESMMSPYFMVGGGEEGGGCGCGWKRWLMEMLPLPWPLFVPLCLIWGTGWGINLNWAWSRGGKCVYCSKIDIWTVALKE